MKFIIYLSLLFFSLTLNAAPVDVKEIIQENFSIKVSIQKEKIILKNDELQAIKKSAKLPVKSKIYRYYKVLADDKLLGFALLITQKVRTKKATVLYFIQTDEKLKFIEILSFLEPREYIPKDVWISQFEDKNTTDRFEIGADIPTISGATLSARSITDGARLAIAIYRVKLK